MNKFVFYFRDNMLNLLEESFPPLDKDNLDLIDVDVSVDKGVVAVFVVDGVVVGGGLAGGAAVVVVVVVVAGVIGGAATTGAGACDVVAPAVAVLGFL